VPVFWCLLVRATVARGGHRIQRIH